MGDKAAMIPIDEIPDCETGAPLPFVMCDEHCLEVIYRICAADEKKFRHAFHEVLDPKGESIAALRFEDCTQHKFGYPNDEALGGHPHFHDGLRWYSCFEFAGSNWAAELAQQNRVHPSHSDIIFSQDRHFIFPFHDTTLECLANSFEVTLYRAWQSQVIAERMNVFLASSSRQVLRVSG